jgi:hypothetical protein
MVLTAAERKLLLLVIGLLVLGTLDDAWRMHADGRRLARHAALPAPRRRSAPTRSRRPTPEPRVPSIRRRLPAVRSISTARRSPSSTPSPASAR